jgi:hypothetical protein
MVTPTLQLTRQTETGIDVRVSWDGDPELVVDVRLADDPRSSWKRYGRIRFPQDADGVWRLEFYLTRFVQLAERWLEGEFDEHRALRKLANPQA